MSFILIPTLIYRLVLLDLLVVFNERQHVFRCILHVALVDSLQLEVVNEG